MLFTPVMKGWSKGTLIYEHLGRMNTPAFKDAGSSSIGFEYLHIKKRSSFDSYAGLEVKYYPSNEGTLVSLPEAYISRSRGNTDWAVGRKILKWTPHEKFWGIGELNALKGFNLMDDDEEGLVGIHFNKSWSNVDLAIFGSGVHIPQLNPTFTIKEGKISGANEWTNPPPTQVRFSGQNIPVYYNLDKPPMGDILLQNSLGTKLSYRWKKGSVSAYGIYKPENLARINATGFYEQTTVEQASVRAKPFINHHIMYGVNAAQELGDLTAKVSWDTINPDHGLDDSFSFEAFKIEPVYTIDSFLTASLTWDKNRYVGLSTNFIELLRGDANNTNVFAKKPKWVRAIGFGAWWKATGKLSFSGNYRQDLVLSDILTRFESRYKFTKHVAVGVGADFLKAPKKRSYWSPYRANDTFFSSLSYMF
ncbi:MAG: hypothetical protein ACJAT2_000624 [Bacteriovoracaceae bacterium]|jgi:hypothetical protein